MRREEVDVALSLARLEERELTTEGDVGLRGNEQRRRIRDDEACLQEL